MKNQKKCIFSVAIGLAFLTSGCGITITRNNFYGYSSEKGLKPTKEQSIKIYKLNTPTQCTNDTIR